MPHDEEAAESGSKPLAEVKITAVNVDLKDIHKFAGYEGEAARVWVVREKDNEKAIELRRIKVGLANGNTVEVLKGLAPGDRVVTRGGLFIDRVAAADSR